MKISELITFIKAGYSPAEIADIKSPGDVAALLSEGVKKDDVPNFLELLADSQAIESEAQAQPDVQPEEKETEDHTDYKAMYQSLLKEKQQQAVRENMAGDVQNFEEAFKEIARSFM